MVLRLRALVTVLLALFAVGGVLAASALAEGPPSAEAGAEAAEAVEEAEETSETARFAVIDSTVLVAHPALAAHMERLKARIAKVRENKRLVRTLPHTTTRWLVHLPKKRAELKAMRAEMRMLRAREAALAAG